MAWMKIDIYVMLLLAVIVLGVGMFLQKKISVLKKFCIPAPVIGGLIFAIITCILHTTGTLDLDYDETLKEFFMNMFFATVGFQASLKELKRGGKALLMVLILSVVLIFLQNFLAIGLAKLLGENAFLGLATGSIPMIGGHGTSAAFGPILEGKNLEGATTIATSAATFGLVMGSLIGGPMAVRLIKKKDLLKTTVDVPEETIPTEEKTKRLDFYITTLLLVFALGMGSLVSYWLSLTGLTFPSYIGAMIIAIILRNIFDHTKHPVGMKYINRIGDVSLSLFLSMAMITLRLWELADLALPLFIILAGQTVLMFLFARFLVFRCCGRNYDAAVITAGVCGFGMGATPNAMANMQAVTQAFKPSAVAFIVIPIVGGMFCDFLNTLILSGFINFLG